MKNTKIIYASTEKTPIVLTDMESLLPPLTAEQFSALEADIVKNGCYSPIVVDQNLSVIDGHNRLKVCGKHHLPYQMAVFEFTDMLEAKQWALETQKARRNLDLWELGRIALRLKPELEAKGRANQSAAGGDKSRKALSEEFHKSPRGTNRHPPADGGVCRNLRRQHGQDHEDRRKRSGGCAQCVGEERNFSQSGVHHHQRGAGTAGRRAGRERCGSASGNQGIQKIRRKAWPSKSQRLRVQHSV